MRKSLVKASAIAIAFSSAALAQSTKPVVPTVAQLAARAKLANVAVSPDGRHIAAMEARGEETVILVWNADALDQKPTVIGATQMKIQGFDFIKDDRLAVALWQPYDFRGEGVTKTFITKLFITDLGGKEWREAITLPRARSEAEEEAQARSSPSVLSVLPDDPDNILVVNAVGSNQGDVFRVNIRNGRSERIQRSEERVGGYRVDAAGNLRSRLRFDSDDRGAFTALQFRDASGNWSEHFRSYAKDRDVTDLVDFIDDPNIAIISTNVGEDRISLFEYDIAARKRGEQLFKHRYFNADGVRTWRMGGTPGIKRGEIVAVGFAGPRENDLVYVSPPLKAVEQSVRAALKIETSSVSFTDTATGESSTAQYNTDRVASIVDTSRDLKTVIISDEPVNQPRSYYMLRDGKLQKLGSSHPDLDTRAFGTTTFTYYRARDGRTIPAFVTRPNETLCGLGPWRSVVMPHGGPWARDAMGFDYFMWVPMLASRCIAVLRPQYRGSEGWGRSLWKAGDAEWGGKMQDDKDDGVKWLIDQKVAIPGRVAMFGFSYGGYAAMAAAVRPNGLYKCAVAGAGVSDIRRIWARFYDSPFFRQAQAPTVKGLSPVDKASEIKIPIMVYHGDRDQTVPIYQSEIFVGPAKRSGQPVEYHELKDFAHGPYWTVAVNQQQLQLFEDYFSKGCGGAGL
jgi:dipeptidyl aminopeptidase/acylaminoacyl peptidase